MQPEKGGKDRKMLNILLKDDDDLKLAHEKYEKFTSDKQLRWLAIDREKAVRDKIYHENMARRKGREEGLQEGRQEGRQETVRKMLTEGLDIKMISRISGLSISEINELTGL